MCWKFSPTKFPDLQCNMNLTKKKNWLTRSVYVWLEQTCMHQAMQWCRVVWKAYRQECNLGEEIKLHFHAYICMYPIISQTQTDKLYCANYFKIWSIYLIRNFCWICQAFSEIYAFTVHLVFFVVFLFLLFSPNTSYNLWEHCCWLPQKIWGTLEGLHICVIQFL